jgi:group I intron endonuclease
MYHLYLIVNLVNWKTYVGITTDPRGRWRAHRNGHGSRIVKAAIDKYGIEWFRFAVVYSGRDYDCVCWMEQQAICELKTKTPHGYNIADGGEGTFGVVWRPETIAKRAQANRGKKRTAETRERMSAWQRGREMSVQARQRMAEAKRGRKQRPEVVARRAAKLRGHQCPANVKEAASKAASKAVLVEGRQYSSIKSAARVLGMKEGTLWSRFARYRQRDSFPVGWGYLSESRLS